MRGEISPTLSPKNLEDQQVMRKACIELIRQTKVVCLVAGERATGRCLYKVVVSKDMTVEPTTAQWANALRMCESKAAELKYDVARVLGRKLAGE